MRFTALMEGLMRIAMAKLGLGVNGGSTRKPGIPQGEGDVMRILQFNE